MRRLTYVGGGELNRFDGFVLCSVVLYTLSSPYPCKEGRAASSVRPVSLSDCQVMRYYGTRWTEGVLSGSSFCVCACGL